MAEEVIKKLLESGVHFGHQTDRWNPKMKKFIFGERSGIYIIDLEQTAQYLAKAKEVAKDLASKGGQILFVGTKKQAQIIIKEEADKIGMPYVTHRWFGGILTNFQTVRKSIQRLEEIEDMAKNGIWESLTKLEISRLTKEKEKLLQNIGGIRNLTDTPTAVFVIDPKREEIAIKEAIKLGLPIISVVDTNCDPDLIDYPIPGNDDALKAIRYLTSVICEGIKEGRAQFDEINKTKAKETSTPAAEAKAAEAPAQEAVAPAAETATAVAESAPVQTEESKPESDETK